MRDPHGYIFFTAMVVAIVGGVCCMAAIATGWWLLFFPSLLWIPAVAYMFGEVGRR